MTRPGCVGEERGGPEGTVGRPRWANRAASSQQVTILFNFKMFHVCMKFEVKVAQLCLSLCDPMGCGPSGSFVPGILQARILEWAAIPFSGGSS